MNGICKLFEKSLSHKIHISPERKAIWVKKAWKEKHYKQWNKKEKVIKWGANINEHTLSRKWEKH